MPKLDDLDGQAHVVRRLRAALDHDRLPHAYLFSCAAPAVSVRAALGLAGALNCERAPGVGCGRGDEGACGACAKIDAGIHPDVIALAREGAARLVPIESVRAQVVARGALAPHEGRVRVFLFDEATALAGPAANALLKTLEEPPARTLFVLCTVAPEQLLPTIRSRCQRVAFAPVPAEVLAADGDAEAAARWAALGARVARFAPRDGAIELAGQIAAGKGEAPVVVGAAAGVLHADARAAVAAGRLGDAQAMARRAEVLAAWQLALTQHNASPALALEAMLDEVGKIGVEVRS